MTEHLLEEQEFSRVVPAHHHLMIGEGLPERVGRHPVAKSEIFRKVLQQRIDRGTVEGFIHIASVVGLTLEHVIAQADTRGMFQVQGHSFHYSRVDGDVPVPFVGSGISRLLLQDGEPIPEGELLIDQIAEVEGEEITYAKSKVDPYDEEHVVPVPTIGYQVLGDPNNIVHALDRFSRMLTGKLCRDGLASRCD